MGDFAEGDFRGRIQFFLDSVLDCTSGKTPCSMLAMTKFEKWLYAMQLVDIWRIQHLQMKDFTDYFGVHNSYGWIFGFHTTLYLGFPNLILKINFDLTIPMFFLDCNFLGDWIHPLLGSWMKVFNRKQLDELTYNLPLAQYEEREECKFQWYAERSRCMNPNAHFSSNLCTRLCLQVEFWHASASMQLLPLHPLLWIACSQVWGWCTGRRK